MASTAHDQDLLELRNFVLGVFRDLHQKIETQNAVIAEQREALKNIGKAKEANKETFKFEAPEILPGVDLDRPDTACSTPECGNIIMGEAEYCRKCGAKRPDPDESQSQEGSDAKEDNNQKEEKPTEDVEDQKARRPSAASGRPSAASERSSMAFELAEVADERPSVVRDSTQVIAVSPRTMEKDDESPTAATPRSGPMAKAFGKSKSKSWQDEPSEEATQKKASLLSMKSKSFQDEPSEEVAQTKASLTSQKSLSFQSQPSDAQIHMTDEEKKASSTSLNSVAKGFGKSKSFQNELLRAEAAGGTTYMADRFGKRSLHFDRLRDLTRSRKFLVTFAVIIVLNAVFTGFVADLSCRGVVDAYLKLSAMGNSSAITTGPEEKLDWEMPMWPFYVDIAFATIFAIEIIMRILGEEIMFFVGVDWFWNTADLVLFLVAILELVLLMLDVDMSVIRVVRLTRVGRTIRMIRLLKYSRDLRVMVISVGHSLLPLAWVSLFLSILLSVFAVVFMLACTNYMEIAGPLEGIGADPENTDIVDTITTYFNSFPMTFVSLFMSVTGGVSWWRFNQPLSNIHPALGVLYLFFILFVVLAVLNTVTAIFVESVTALAETDKELVTQKQQEQIAKYISELRDVFITLDEDGSGTLTLEEFQARADDPQVIAYFEALEIDAMKATDFFKLFDIDGSGSLEIEEFVAGCMRIKGGAKAVDIETIMHENQKLMTKFKEFFDRSARGFSRIERMVQHLYKHMFDKFNETDDTLERFDKAQKAIDQKVGPARGPSLIAPAAPPAAASAAAAGGMFSYLWSSGSAPAGTDAIDEVSI